MKVRCVCVTHVTYFLIATKFNDNKFKGAAPHGRPLTLPCLRQDPE